MNDKIVQLLYYYSGEGRTLNSITHLCGRKRRTLIRYARMFKLPFPDLRAPPKKKEAGE